MKMQNEEDEIWKLDLLIERKCNLPLIILVTNLY